MQNEERDDVAERKKSSHIPLESSDGCWEKG